MKINRIDHIGIAVTDIKKIKTIYETIFELKPSFEEVVSTQKVTTVGYKIDKTNIEFLEPTHDDSPISNFLSKRKNAVHHIALQVDNLTQTLSTLKEKGVQLIDEKPRIGAEKKHIAFIHPKSTGGILIELSEKK